MLTAFMTLETVEKLLFLVLGWLLGLFAPIIVDAIKRRRAIRELRAGLLVELHELQYRLVLKIYSLRGKLGNYDKQLLLWMKPIVSRYEGLNPRENFLRHIDEALALSDDQLKAVSQASTGSPLKGLALKKYPTPLLDSKVGEAILLGKEFQNTLLEIRAHLNILNEDIDQYRFYFNLTFSSSLSSDNRALVLENIRGAYDNIATQAKIVVDLIDRSGSC